MDNILNTCFDWVKGSIVAFVIVGLLWATGYATPIAMFDWGLAMIRFVLVGWAGFVPGIGSWVALIVAFLVSVAIVDWFLHLANVALGALRGFTGGVFNRG
ncbi:MAG: hypothetical protein Q7S95_01470 [bacterium]|nr:hypothetical protein [bacterium]